MTPRGNNILQGTLGLLVLRTLEARGPLHGYAITSAIHGLSDKLLRVEEGSLYPALHQRVWSRRGGSRPSGASPTRTDEPASTPSPPPAGGGSRGSGGGGTG